MCAARGKIRRRNARPSDAGCDAMGDVSGRTCVVCRQQREPRDLLRVNFNACDNENSLVVSGYGGRGVHICVSAACLQNLEARHLARALRAEIVAKDIDHLRREVLPQLGLGRLLGTLGLARRLGVLVIGVDAVIEMPVGSVSFVAIDISDRSKRSLPKSTKPFVDSHTMGAACGLGRAGALGVTTGELANRAAYWFSVWYESGRACDGAKDGATAPEIAPTRHLRLGEQGGGHV